MPIYVNGVKEDALMALLPRTLDSLVEKKKTEWNVNLYKISLMIYFINMLEMDIDPCMIYIDTKAERKGTNTFKTL